MTSYRNDTPSIFIILWVVFIVGALCYEGSVAYQCHQKKGTLVRSYWTKLPKCVEPRP